jgi:truncated hemoglobin YjbI
MRTLDRSIEFADEIVAETNGARALFDRFGGRPFLDRLHKVFYDKVYAHPWIGQFFKDVEQTHIEMQQSDFIAQLTGGPKKFFGRMPVNAHVHIMITDELFSLRHQLLAESLTEIGTPEKEKNELLKIDMAFKKILVKTSIDQCGKRFKMDEIVDIPNPLALRRAS